MVTADYVQDEYAEEAGNKEENWAKTCREKKQWEEECGPWEMVFSVSGILLCVRPDHNTLFPHLEIWLRDCGITTGQVTAHVCIYWFLLLYQEVPIINYWCIKKGEKKNVPLPCLQMTKNYKFSYIKWVCLYLLSQGVSTSELDWNTLVYPKLRKGWGEPPPPTMKTIAHLPLDLN